MEKKTMGSFIAALRKSQGMTQRDLAERLNVSDKSVSRWECDEGYPDLSLIPVIAEIFGVTADELLRGERKPMEERVHVDEEVLGAKGRKELQRLRKKALVDFRDWSLVSIGVSLLGLIAAAVCNLAFNKGILGFFFGAAFTLIALLVEAIFANSAFSKEYGEGEDDGTRRKMMGLLETAFIVGLASFSFCLPLILLLPDSHMGLVGADWLEYGGLFALVTVFCSLMVFHFLNGHMARSGGMNLSQEDVEEYDRNHRMKTRIALLFALVFLLTGALHLQSTQMWGPSSVMEGTVFEDLESFKAYMETEVPRPYDGAPEAVAEEDIRYFDENGRAITKEEAQRKTLRDKDGNVILEYQDRNGNVLSVSYSVGKDGSVLPITTYTYEDYRVGEAVVASRNTIFSILYVVEVGLSVLLYLFLKRKGKK